MLVSGTNGITVNAAATDVVILAGLDVEELRNNSKTIRALAEPTHTQVIESLRLGINDAFRFAALMSALGIITSLFMKSRPLRGTIRE